MLPFMASYLGIVNVSFRAIGDNLLTNNTPVVMLEHNRHLLGGDDVDELTMDESNTGTFFV